MDSMEDDCNTASAIGHIFACVRLINRILEDKKLRQLEGTKKLLDDFALSAAAWADILGVFGSDPTPGAERRKRFPVAPSDTKSIKNGTSRFQAKAFLPLIEPFL